MTISNDMLDRLCKLKGEKDLYVTRGFDIPGASVLIEKLDEKGHATGFVDITQLSNLEMYPPHLEANEHPDWGEAFRAIKDPEEKPRRRNKKPISVRDYYGP